MTELLNAEKILVELNKAYLDYGEAKIAHGVNAAVLTELKNSLADKIALAFVGGEVEGKNAESRGKWLLVHFQAQYSAVHIAEQQVFGSRIAMELEELKLKNWRDILRLAEIDTRILSDQESITGWAQ